MGDAAFETLTLQHAGAIMIGDDVFF